MESLYPVLSGAMAQEKRLELITNNLANVSTSGFKKDFAVFEGLTPPPNGFADSGGSVGLMQNVSLGLSGANATFGMLKEVRTDFAPGSLQVTDQPLDLAIDGEGFFSIETPEGLRYTRNGHFRLDADAQVVTSQGFPLLGDGGPIVLPPGDVTILSDGTVFVQGTEQGAAPVAIGRLPIFEFPNAGDLKKVGGSLFKALGDDPAASLDAKVIQGTLEGSNVNAVEEMVAMVQVMRLYEAAQKAMQAADEVAGQAANEIGRLS